MKNHSMPVMDKPLIVGIPGYWGAVIPPLQHSAYGNVVLENQFETLVRRGKNGLIEPLAAKSWEISPDHRTIRFKIDTGRRFSDGSNLSAADFKKSWEDGLRMKAKSNNKAVEDALYSLKGFKLFDKKGTIEGVRAKGEDILELEFMEPARVPLGYLSGARYAAYKLADGRSLGTGPYVMEEKDKTLVLTPNRYYTGDEPRFKELRIVVTSPGAMREKLQSREIDAAIFADRSNLGECSKGTGDGIHCLFSQEADHLEVDVNGLPGRLFSDRACRQALQALVHQAFKNKGLPAELLIGHFAPDPQSFMDFQPGRLTDAKAEAIMAEGRKHIPRLIKASQKTPIYLVSARDCGWLISLLREAGIKVSEKSDNLDFTRVLEMIYKTHEADLIYGSFSVYNGDPDGLYHLLGKHGAIFSPAMDRPGIADLMESGRRITDQAQLAPHYEKVAKAILTEVPYVHLGYSSRGVAYNPEKVRVAESFVTRNNHRVTLFEPR